MYLVLPRISDDLYDEKYTRIETGGCGCCSDIIAGCELNDDCQPEYRIDYEELQKARDEIAKALHIVESMLRDRTDTD